jgi:purine-binding chemotaxis protein CheW
VIETLQLCTFRLDELCLGIDVRKVHEVLSNRPLRAIPLAPPSVRGLISLRGQVIAGIDLRVCIGLAQVIGKNLWTNVIVKTASGPLSLLVDEVSDVVEIELEQIEPAPETLPPLIRQITTGVFSYQTRLIFMIDEEQVTRLAISTDAVSQTIH